MLVCWCVCLAMVSSFILICCCSCCCFVSFIETLCERKNSEITLMAPASYPCTVPSSSSSSSPTATAASSSSSSVAAAAAASSQQAAAEDKVSVPVEVCHLSERMITDGRYLIVREDRLITDSVAIASQVYYCCFLVLFCSYLFCCLSLSFLFLFCWREQH